MHSQCKRAWVAVFKFLDDLEKEPVSPEVIQRAKKLQHIVSEVGYHIIDMEQLDRRIL